MSTRADDGARGLGYPANLDAFERYPLLFGPSPVHRLERLTSHLGGATLWAKRDDCNSGLAYGGNKTRKLEYLVADALAQGCDTLVSIGGVQSNHTRQVAAAAARTGMGCVLAQESWVDWPDVTYDRVGNIQLSRIMGADVRLVDAIGLGRDLREEKIVVEDRYHAGTYGIPDEGNLEAIRLTGRLEGMITDPVYEGKSMAGMIDLVAGGEIDGDSNVLYAHLGGQPTLSAYAALFAR